MRRLLACALMVSGLGSATAGAYVQWGAGVSLLVAAGLLIPLSILTGWE